MIRSRAGRRQGVNGVVIVAVIIAATVAAIVAATLSTTVADRRVNPRSFHISVIHERYLTSCFNEVKKGLELHELIGALFLVNVHVITQYSQQHIANTAVTPFHTY